MRRTFTAIAVGAVLLISGAGCGPAATPTAAGSGSAEPSASSTPSPTPANEERTVTETEVIPYKTRRVNDPTLARGETKVRIRGVKGVRTLTYKVTVTDGVETGRKLVRKAVTRAPVTRIIAVGTKRTRQCDPNYSGACVPITSDVDCAGGSGDGPGYVQGPVRVVGSDIHDLDRDGDGIACD
ncbi:G5 domain-containing protein [Spirillospora sp. NPDC029432]|uniref:G5 domain-containing protein n=1 Tax=Spirillospora sp. NPDC029432 TaxID=3154599 RepID=UPI0034519646